MVKTKSNEVTDKLVIDLVDNNLLKHTIQFFYKTKEGLRPFGSGVLTKICDTFFILTASHVADYLAKDENQLYIRVDFKKFINVVGEIKYTEINKSDGVDLAYIKIDPQMIPALTRPHKPLTIDRISDHNKMLDGSNYCVVGFPEKNIRFKEGEMNTGASFYLTSASNENPYNHYKLSKELYFILEIKGKGTDIETGRKNKINTDFYGISGCGLWYIHFYLDPDTNEYSADYRLIGIMTEFKKGKYFCLIANKIHLIIDALRTIEGLKITEKKS